MAKKSKARRKARVRAEYLRIRKANFGVAVMTPEVCHTLAKRRSKRDPLWSWLTDWTRSIWS